MKLSGCRGAELSRPWSFKHQVSLLPSLGFEIERWWNVRARRAIGMSIGCRRADMRLMRNRTRKENLAPSWSRRATITRQLCNSSGKNVKSNLLSPRTRCVSLSNLTPRGDLFPAPTWPNERKRAKQTQTDTFFMAPPQPNPGWPRPCGDAVTCGKTEGENGREGGGGGAPQPLRAQHSMATDHEIWTLPAGTRTRELLLHSRPRSTAHFRALRSPDRNTNSRLDAGEKYLWQSGGRATWLSRRRAVGPSVVAAQNLNSEAVGMSGRKPVAPLGPRGSDVVAPSLGLRVIGYNRDVHRPPRGDSRSARNRTRKNTWHPRGPIDREASTNLHMEASECEIDFTISANARRAAFEFDTLRRPAFRSDGTRTINGNEGIDPSRRRERFIASKTLPRGLTTCDNPVEVSNFDWALAI